MDGKGNGKIWDVPRCDDDQTVSSLCESLLIF